MHVRGLRYTLQLVVIVIGTRCTQLQYHWNQRLEAVGKVVPLEDGTAVSPPPVLLLLLLFLFISVLNWRCKLQDISEGVRV